MLLRLVVGVLLLGLPLVGALIVGLPLARYLEFPPITHPTVGAPFSWTAFCIVATVPVVTVIPFLWRILRAGGPPRCLPMRSFPWWGMVALLWTGILWMVAWSTLPIATEIRRFSFTPLWFGYIVVVNALLWRRTGSSLLTHQPRFLAKLFVLSAAFWWFFEYLNRFVQNWYYQGIEQYTPVEYFLTATLPFSTVLPAVLSTYRLLRTYPRLWWGIQDAWRLSPKQPRSLGMLALLLGSLGLLCIAVFPQQLYPLVWVAPLVLVAAVRAIAGKTTVFSPLTRGDWRPVWVAALAGLLCGFFWEMWNWGSFPRWVYSVPGVQRFHVFEMPLLGYAGYLPFGVECLVVAHFYLSTPFPEDLDADE